MDDLLCDIAKDIYSDYLKAKTHKKSVVFLKEYRKIIGMLEELRGANGQQNKGIDI